jgi:hypothetical protein
MRAIFDNDQDLINAAESRDINQGRRWCNGEKYLWIHSLKVCKKKQGYDDIVKILKAAGTK